MAIRNATSNFTFEQWRVEFNELAADVANISGGVTGSVPSGSSTHTTVESALEALVVDVNSIINGTHNFTGDVTFGANVSVTGNLTLGGNIVIGDQVTDTVSVDASLTSNLIPEASNAKDIGSSTKSWRNIYIGTEAILATAKISNLNSTEIPVAGTDGLLDGSNSLTFSSLTLTTPNISVGTEATLASAKVSDLTAGRVVLAGTSGELETDSKFVFDKSGTGTFTANADTTISRGLTVNLATDLDSTLNVDGNTTLTANTGSTSTTSGTLVVTGGTGISQNLYVGGNIVSTGSISVAGGTPFTTEGFSIAISVALG